MTSAAGGNGLKNFRVDDTCPAGRPGDGHSVEVNIEAIGFTGSDVSASFSLRGHCLICR